MAFGLLAKSALAGNNGLHIEDVWLDQ